MNRKIVIPFVIFIWVILIPACTPEQNVISGNQKPTYQSEIRPLNKPTATGSSSMPQIPTPTAEDLNLDTVPILLIGIEEQPFTSITKSIKSSTEDAIRYANEYVELGGMKVELHYTATKSISESIIETFLEQYEEINPLIVLMAAPVDEELAREINRLRVPTLYFGLGGSRLEFNTQEEDYLFWLTPLPDEQFAFFLEQTWKNWEELRPPGIFNEFRIGYLTWDGLPSKFSITPKLDAFNKEKQFDFIFEGEVAKTSPASATNFLLDCVTYGITIVYTDTFGFSPMVLLNDVYSLGLNNFFVIGGSLWSYDQRDINFLLAPDDVVKFNIPLPVKWWSDENDPSIILANQIIDRAGRSDQEKNLAYLLALGAMDISLHVIQGVDQTKGGKGVSREQIYSQLVNLNGYSVLDGLFEVDYSGGNRSTKNLRLWSVTPDHQWVPIGIEMNVPDIGDDDNTGN
jgi:hypothetical protein